MDAAALAESLLHTERALAGAMRQHAIRQQSKSSTTKGHAAHRSNCETTPETPSIEPKTKKNWTKVSGKFAALKTAASFAVAHGPAGTTRKVFKGYEEVSVPAQAQKPVGEDERLVEIEEMDEWAQLAFDGKATVLGVQRTACCGVCTYFSTQIVVYLLL